MTAPALQPTEAQTKTVQYRVTDWPEYYRVLVRRGGLTVWFDEAFLQERWRPVPTGQWGGRSAAHLAQGPFGGGGQGQRRAGGRGHH